MPQDRDALRAYEKNTTAGGLFGAIGYRVAVKIVGGDWAKKFHAHSDRCILTIDGSMVPGSAFACSPCSRSDPLEDVRLTASYTDRL